MKKFTLLLMASVLLVPSVSVAKGFQPLKSFNGSVPTQRIDNQKIVNNSLKYNQMLDLKTKSPKKSSVAKVSEYGDIIYEAPAGVAKTLARSGEATFAYFGMLVGTSYDNKVSELVVSDDGYVYMKDPISQYPTGTYIKGKQDGNKIVFDLPQAIAAIDYNGEEIYFLVTTMQYCDEWYYPCNTPEAEEMGLPEITDQLVVNVNEDGSYMMDIDENKSLIPGMIYSDDLAWTGYSELSSEWKEFSGSLNPGPAEGVAIDDVFVIYGDMGHYAKLAMDGDNVFVQGIFAAQPERWIQGKLEDNKISFPSGQYLGEDLEYGFYTYFAAATIEEVWDEDYEEWYNVYNYTDEIIFNYDEDTQTMTSGENDAVAYNTSDSRINYLAVLNAPVIEKQPAEISQTPKNPYQLEFYNYYEDYGYSWIECELPMFNTDDVLLNSADLYYKVYVDGYEFVFDPDEYMYLEKEMSLIPYNFSESYDFIANGTYHEIYFYFDGAETIGIQLCSVKDGEIVGESDIVSVGTSNVMKNVMESDSKYIISTRYFNMTGQEVTNPGQGIYVKSVKYEDGSVKSYKTIKK